MPKNKDIRTGAVFRSYLKAAGKYPWIFGAVIVGIFLIEGASLAGPLYLRQFINLLSGATPSGALIHSLLIILGIFALIRVIGWIAHRTFDFSISNLEAHAMRDLYDSAFKSLLIHSHEFFISNFTGTLTRRVNRFVRSFEQIFDVMMFAFIPTGLFAVGAIVVLSLRNIWLGVGLLAWTVTFVSLQFYMTRRIQPLRIANSEADSVVTGVLSDSVLNHSTITAFAALDRETQTFTTKTREWFMATLRSWNASNWVGLIQGALSVVAELGVLFAALFFWGKGVLTIGDFVLIQIYVIGLIDRVWNIGRNMRQVYDSLADATEMIDIIDKPRDIVDVPGAQSLVVREGVISFDHVHFEYHGGRRVLTDCNLTIAPHEKVAIVGPSGAGKSTITKLLLRLYDLSGGTISIDGQDIATVTQESLRRAIAFVPQDPSLFHRSLRENIRYGRPDATDEEVLNAARQAHCLEFIEHYPEGLDTMVGERGVKLSGGERQRVAIARAILKNAPILILDEATSSLDSESEALIQDALGKLMEGKTVIAIAHRLSTIMHMDRIIVMENGAIVLSGTHDELLAEKSNLYKKLWEIQAGGFIVRDKAGKCVL